MKTYFTLLCILCSHWLFAQSNMSSAPAVKYDPSPAEMWYNSYRPIDVAGFNQSPYSIFKFVTDAASVRMSAWSNLNIFDSANSRFRIRIDGVQQEPIQIVNGINYYDLPLGQAGVPKTVEITIGLQIQIFERELKSLYGTEIHSIFYPAQASFSVVQPVAPELLILGTSIMSGYFADIADTEGVFALLRNNYQVKASLHGWSAATLWQETNCPERRNALVNQIMKIFAGNDYPKIWIERQTNDFGLYDGVQNAASYESNTAAFLDELKDSLPNVKVYLQTATVRTMGASINQFGNSLSDYRAASAAIAAARTSWVTFVDGLQMVSLSNLRDGLHPNSQGMAEYAANIVSILSSTTATVLPMHFSSIGVTCNNGAVLNFRTEQEVNTQYFSVEKSENGTDWIPVGRVAPKAGNSLQNTYTFTENTSGKYYRVVQTAKDGTKVFSSVVRSSCGSGKSIKVVPNPVINSAVLAITSPVAEEVSLVVYDMNGRMVKQSNATISAGNTNLQLDLGPLANGLYTLKVVSDKQDVESVRIIKAGQ